MSHAVHVKLWHAQIPDDPYTHMRELHWQVHVRQALAVYLYWRLGHCLVCVNGARTRVGVATTLDELDIFWNPSVVVKHCYVWPGAMSPRHKSAVCIILKQKQKQTHKHAQIGMSGTAEGSMILHWNCNVLQYCKIAGCSPWRRHDRHFVQNRNPQHNQDHPFQYDKRVNKCCRE